MNTSTVTYILALLLRSQNVFGAPKLNIKQVSTKDPVDRGSFQDQLHFLMTASNPDSDTYDSLENIVKHLVRNLVKYSLPKSGDEICFEDGTCVDLGDIGVHPFDKQRKHKYKASDQASKQLNPNIDK